MTAAMRAREGGGRLRTVVCRGPRPARRRWRSMASRPCARRSSSPPAKLMLTTAAPSLLREVQSPAAADRSRRREPVLLAGPNAAMARTSGIGRRPAQQASGRDVSRTICVPVVHRGRRVEHAREPHSRRTRAPDARGSGAVSITAIGHAPPGSPWTPPPASRGRACRAHIVPRRGLRAVDPVGPGIGDAGVAASPRDHRRPRDRPSSIRKRNDAGADQPHLGASEDVRSALSDGHSRSPAAAPRPGARDAITTRASISSASYAPPTLGSGAASVPKRAGGRGGIAADSGARGRRRDARRCTASVATWSPAAGFSTAGWES